MKRKWIIAIVIILILVGGYKIVEKKKIDEYVERQKPRIEKYLKYNYDNIDSITITGTSKNPMGGFSIKGYINDDKNLTILAKASLDSDIENVDGLPSSFYDKYKKKELNGKAVPVSKIIEEEQKDRVKGMFD